MVTIKLKRLRRQALAEQGGYCFYCELPVWEGDGQIFAATHGIPIRLCRHLRCTAEHLLARTNSGRDIPANIVAACLWCNQQRHRGRENSAPKPAVYKAWVRRQVVQAKWHPVIASRAARQMLWREGAQ